MHTVKYAPIKDNVMDVSELSNGIIITGPPWAEPVEVHHFEEKNSNVRIIGTMVDSQLSVNDILSYSELEKVKKMSATCDFSGDASKVFLTLEAKRYKFAYLYDPLLAMSTSKVDPLPHQIEAVYGVVLKLPKIRFLLAHDPGAGKTIMAGLIIKELRLRHLITRVLIITPGHLKDQWRRELKEKFEELFIPIDRNSVDSAYGFNVWEKERSIITSIDFAKQDDIRQSLTDVNFDLIIVDEAHKMAAHKSSNKIRKTDRYKLGQILADNSDHLLFLTATPHQGNRDNFLLFLDLLIPGLSSSQESLATTVHNQEIFLRRVKEDMRDFDGKPLFLSRFVDTISHDLSSDESELYQQVTNYVKTQYDKAISIGKKRSIGFALTILQRRLSSSCFALHQSLERRKNKLERLLEKSEQIQMEEIDRFDMDEIDDLSDHERNEHEKKWETLSLATDAVELQREIDTLSLLIQKSNDIIQKENESKLSELKNALSKFMPKTKNEKILIFTESRDTLTYLNKKIQNWGYITSVIHGGMKLEDRIESEKEFKNNSQIMIATEAAGEGINLQFCHFMINYDIPWNPNRLEQRMGRIHRYGQKFEVHVYNLFTNDTIEGRILKKMFDKIEEIKKMMGSDKVYDIIGEVYDSKKFAEMLTDAALRTRTEEDVSNDLDIKVDAEYINKIRENLKDSLATRHIDFTQIKEMRQKARENKLIPEYTKEFFKKVFIQAGGKIRIRQDDLIALDSIPYSLKLITNDDLFRRKFGVILPSYKKITFDKKLTPVNTDAEFVSFEHPLFEASLMWVDRKLHDELKKGASFVDPSGYLNGFILFYEGSILDGERKIAGKRLFSYYVNPNTGSIEYVNPTILWDLEADNNLSNKETNIDQLKQLVEPKIYEDLKIYVQELSIERDRQYQIIKKYTLGSLSQQITDTEWKIHELEVRKQRGEPVDMALRNANDQRTRLVDNNLSRRRSLEQSTQLIRSTPMFVGAISVNPSSDAVHDNLKRDIEIEKIAMNIVMKYERDHGRTPTDISKEIGPGYDIRSYDTNGNIRCIEVKGRKQIGAISLTTNEWFKAKNLDDDYFLYVVWNLEKSHNDAVPIIIQNPAKILKPEKNIHYIINAEQIKLQL